MPRPSLDTPIWTRAKGRDVAALLDPRPAVLVGALSDAGEVCFATVVWATPVSHTPPLVAFALREKSHTMGIVRETGCFSLCVPPADDEGSRLVEFCGGNTGRLVDKGAIVSHTLVSASGAEDRACGGASAPDTSSAPNERLVPVPLHCYSWETGTVESIQQAGDHLLVVGLVTAAATQAPRDERGQLTPYHSLLCVQHGNYGRVHATKEHIPPTGD